MVSISVESTRFLAALAPRIYEEKASSQRFSCLKNSANLFALGRSMSVHVVYVEENRGLVVEQKTVEQSWLIRAFKVALLATVILPLLAYLGAKLYAKMNPLPIQERVNFVAEPANSGVNPLVETIKEIKVVRLSSLFCGPHPEVEGLNIDLPASANWVSDFSNLKVLHLNHSAITDISFLKDCPHLKKLSLAGAWDVTDFSHVRHCSEVISLDFMGCYHLKNVSFLENCKQLMTLDLSGCQQIEDISFLENCPRLTKLTLAACDQISDISFLRHCKQLTTLSLLGCSLITNISFLRECQQLERLYIEGSEHITNLSFAKDNPKLQIFR